MYFLFYFEDLFPCVSSLFSLSLCWLPASPWFPSPASCCPCVLKSCESLCVPFVSVVSVVTVCHVLASKPVFVPLLTLRSCPGIQVCVLHPLCCLVFVFCVPGHFTPQPRFWLIPFSFLVFVGTWICPVSAFNKAYFKFDFCLVVCILGSLGWVDFHFNIVKNHLRLETYWQTAAHWCERASVDRV